MSKEQLFGSVQNLSQTQSGSTFTLHTADLSSISSTVHGPLRLAGVFPEHRARAVSTARCGQNPKEEKKKKKK